MTGSGPLPLAAVERLRAPGRPLLKGSLRETHRLVSPEETLERIERAGLRRLAGITRVANVTGLDVVGVPVVSVCRPNSRSLSIAQGKGVSLAAAKASGLMEAIELYAAERPVLPLQRASFSEVSARAQALDPSRWNRPRNGWYRPNLPILWTPAEDVASGEEVWVPFDLVHVDWTLPLPSGSEVFCMTSNGLASGNHPLEALSHAICELIERDATTLFYRLSPAARQRRRLALDTVDAASCRDVLARFSRAGVRVAIWDITTDIGIPAFLCLTCEHSPGVHWAGPVGGEGCHVSREIALLRALTEAAQKRLTMIGGSRDDLGYAEYQKRTDPEYVSTTARLVLRDDGERSFQAAPTRELASFDEDLAWQLECLSRAGITQVLAVELARYECGVSVLRALIPGLETIHELPGYVPGPRAHAQSEQHA